MESRISGRGCVTHSSVRVCTLALPSARRGTIKSKSATTVWSSASHPVPPLLEFAVAVAHAIFSSRTTVSSRVSHFVEVKSALKSFSVSRNFSLLNSKPASDLFCFSFSRRPPKACCERSSSPPISDRAGEAFGVPFGVFLPGVHPAPDPR